MNRIRKLLTAIILCVVGIFFISDLGIDIMSVEGVIPVGIILITGVMLYIKLTNTTETNQSSEEYQESEEYQASKTSIRYYCKWYGDYYSSIRLLTGERCKKNPNSDYHEPER